MSPIPRKLASASRWVHTYLTMFALVAMSFFAVTGLMLNHSEWFGLDEVRAVTRTGTLPMELVGEADRLAIVEKLRSDFGAAGAVEAFEADEEEFYVAFARPGRRSQATVSRTDGSVEVVTEVRGPAAVLTELHRGAQAGQCWRVLLDATAVMVILAATTGVVIWLSLPRRRLWGVVALLGSLGVWAGAYLLLIPD